MLVMFNFENVISNIEMSVIISIIAVIVAFISAFYARRSAKEAKKANDIGRLNALFAFRAHYLVPDGKPLFFKITDDDETS